VRGAPTAGQQAVVDMHVYHVLRTLLAGVLDARNVNYVNSQRV
jgi:hypothetical protein